MATREEQRCPGEGGQGCWSLGDPKRYDGTCLFPHRRLRPRILHRGSKGQSTHSSPQGVLGQREAVVQIPAA